MLAFERMNSDKELETYDGKGEPIGQCRERAHWRMPISNRLHDGICRLFVHQLDEVLADAQSDGLSLGMSPPEVGGTAPGKR